MGTISFSGINYLAVAVAAFITFFLAGMWYQALFSKAWIAAHGYTETQVRELQAKTPMPMFLGLMALCYLVLAAVLAVIFRAGQIETWTSGALWGFVLWLALATLKMTDHIASGKRLAAFGIDSSFQLIALVVTGAIVGGWN